MAKWHQQRKISLADSAIVAKYEITKDQTRFNCAFVILHAACIVSLIYLLTGGLNG